jgi:transposase
MMTKQKDSAKKAIRDIRRATRRQYSAEEKIRIVLEGLRGESSIAARDKASREVRGRT